jgi:hypothetical protein
VANKKNLALTGVEDPVTYNNRGAGYGSASKLWVRSISSLTSWRS